MRIVLASASPRRQELLKYIFNEFDIITSSAEENAVFHTPDDYVMNLSLQKAQNVVTQIRENHSKYNEYLVIGADTIVFNKGSVLGKPNDEQMAYNILKNLSGHSHQVFTGVSVLSYTNVNGSESMKKLCCFAEETVVYVSSLSDQEIKDYIATKDPMDKAGAYGIQGPFGKYISSIEGDYYNVVGLPVSRLYQELKNVQSSTTYATLLQNL